MRGILLFVTLLIMAGCTQSHEDVATISTSEEFYAIIEGSNTNQTRTYVDGNITTRWHADDRLTIFKKETYNREYKFKGKTGDNSGGFTQVSVDDDFYSSEQLDKNYAVYPHSDDNRFNKQTESFELTIPAEQTYAENTFGRGANTMVAVSETGQLLFKNVGSFLRVRLWGEDTAVSSITITSNGDEVIAGEATVKPTMDGDPTCVMTGSEKSITLNCPTPITISETESAPTDFWIVLPPVILKDGFTITVTNTNDETQEFVRETSFSFERNLYYNATRHVTFAPSLEIPSNQIWYTATAKVEPYNKDAFGVAIESNEWDSTTGEGVITFDGTINTIGSYAFYMCSNLQSIRIPKYVTSIKTSAFRECLKLNDVYLNSEIESIGKNAFVGCYDIYNSSRGSINFYINSIEDWCKIDIPQEITSGQETIYLKVNDMPVTDVIIPETTTIIKPYAFKYCNVKSVSIHENISSIGDEAFYQCGLNEFSCKSSTPPIGGNDMFEYNNELKIYVPQTSVDAYKTADGWKDYRFIIEGYNFTE